VKNAHPPLITPQLFAAAQALLEQGHPGRREAWGDYLLRGFGRCALCGGTLIRYRDYNNWRRDRDRPVAARSYKDVLACYRYYQYRCERGFRNWVAMADAEATILGTIRQVLAGQVTLAPDQIVWGGREELTRQLNAVRRQLGQIRERFQRQVVAYEQGILDLNELRAAKQRLAAEQAELETTLQDIQ
jgi:hypothetical protein